MANIIRIGGGGGSTPTLITKSITQNGTYNASSDNADGYSEVDVNVSGGGQLNLLYSLDQSQGGQWLNTNIDTTQYDKLLFINSVNGDDGYMREIAISDIIVVNSGTSDTYTEVFSAGAIGKMFICHIYNNELWVGYSASGSSGNVVSVYNEISGGGGASFEEVKTAGIISTDRTYATTTFNDVSNYDYLYIRIYLSTHSNWCYIIPVSSIPTTGYLSITLKTEDTNKAVECALTRTSLRSTYYSGNYTYIYADIVGSNAHPFS